MKKIFIIFCLPILALALTGTTFAQALPPTKATAITIVGNGQTPAPSGQLVTVVTGRRTSTTYYRSSNTCGGRYDLSNSKKYPIGNFGDPNCDFSKDAVNSLIEATETNKTRFCGNSGKCYDRVEIWKAIVQCESGYNPNAFNPNSSSGWGAWGLLQMNPDYAGKAVHDNGTTDWKNQIIHAITRNNNTGGGFGYWSCSRGFRGGYK